MSLSHVKEKKKTKEDKTMLEFTTEAEKVEEDLESSGIFSKNNWIIFNIIYLLQLHEDGVQNWLDFSERNRCYEHVIFKVVAKLFTNTTELRSYFE